MVYEEVNINLVKLITNRLLVKIVLKYDETSVNGICQLQDLFKSGKRRRSIRSAAGNAPILGVYSQQRVFANRWDGVIPSVSNWVSPSFVLESV
jgi:hypothetical protein